MKTNLGNSSDFGVNLIAYIRAEMGLGTAGRGLAMALESGQVPFNVINFEHANPGHHRDDSWRHKEADHSAYDFTVFALNPDNLSNAADWARKERVRDHYRIGYWFWELPSIPDSWLASFSLVDEVWAASHFVQDAIALQSPVPVFRVPVAVRLGEPGRVTRQNFGLPDRQFLFLSISDTHSELARKNPLGAVRAFKKAFPGDNKRAGLVLKISNVDSIHADRETMDRIREEIEGHRNIYLLDRTMTREEIDALLGQCNCYLSLHRSEGFGLGPAEAMSLGKPAILTNWSGNVDYMTPHNSIAIDYRLVPLGKQYGPYPPDAIWAEPDLEQAADWMRRLVQDPELANRIGELGRKTIEDEFSPEAVGKLIHQRLTGLAEIGASGRTVTVSHQNGEATATIRSGSVPEDVSMTIYAAGHFGYREDSSLDIPYQTQRWAHLHSALEHGVGLRALRLDPINAPGLIDIAAIAVKSAVTGDVLWKASGRGGLESLETGGSAIRIPHSRIARVFSYGDDPQIFLPLLAGPEFDQPLRLEIWLKIETRTEPIQAAMRELNQAAVKLVVSARAENLSPQEMERGWRWEAEFEKNQREMQELARALDEARRGLLSKEEALGRGHAEIRQREKELSAVKSELTGAQADLRAVSDKLSEARDEIALHKARLVQRQNELGLAAQELAANTSELAKVAAELEILKARLLDQQNTIADLRAKPFRQALDALPIFRRFQNGTASDGLNDGIAQSKDTFWLEHPATSTSTQRRVVISGWVVTPSGERIEGVRATIEGEIINGIHGMERADVAAAHNDRSDYLHSGFLIEPDLTPGSYEITLEYLTRSEGWTPFCCFQHEVLEPSGDADPASRHLDQPHTSP